MPAPRRSARLRSNSWRRHFSGYRSVRKKERLKSLLQILLGGMEGAGVGMTFPDVISSAARNLGETGRRYSAGRVCWWGAGRLGV